MKEKKVKKPSKKFLKRLILTLVVTAGLAVGAVGIFFGYTVIKEISAFDSSSLTNKQPSVQISVQTGEEYMVLGTEGARKTVEYDDIPQVMIDAVIAAEDSRYFEHNGFDLPRIVKALIGNVAAGGITGGGSTITQQVIKNSYYTDALTGNETIIDKLQRKVGEVVLAIKLTSDTTKEKVLELYLNKIYFGYGNKTVGIYNASRYYFDKDVQELTLPEAALLAGTLNSPNRYDPFKNLDLATQRRNTVLDLMEYHGYISEQERDAAKSVPVENTLKYNPVNSGGQYQAYADMVTREIQEKTGLDPYTTPMKIYTYMNPTLQKRLDEISQGINYKYYDEYIQTGACVQDLNGRIVGVLSSRNYEALGSTNAYAKEGVKTGGYGQTHQPGSTLKPIIAYASAFEFLNYSTAHYVSDTPITYENGMSPKNHDGKYHGDLSIKDALSNSWNLAAIQTLKEVVAEVGSKKVIEYLEGFGFDMTGENFALGYAIGGWDYGTTPKEVAGAYAAIANGGTYIEPHTVEKIEIIETGEVINFDEEIQKEKSTAISEESAFMIREIMVEYVKDGYSGLNMGYQIGAKTGTTNYASTHPVKALQGKSKDGWMSAFSPDYSWSLWVGYPESVANEKGLYLKGTQDRNAISKEIAKVLHKNGVQNEYSEQPSSVVKDEIVTGLYPYATPGEDVPEHRIASGYFKKENTPSRVVNAADLNQLKDFKVNVSNNNTVTVEFTKYDPESMTKEKPIPTKKYGKTELPYLRDDKQVYGRVVYKVEVKDVFGNIVHTQIFNTHTGKLTYKLTPGLYYTISGCYAYEIGTKTSNIVDKQVIGTIQLPITPPPTTPTDPTDTNTQQNGDQQIDQQQSNTNP